MAYNKQLKPNDSISQVIEIHDSAVLGNHSITKNVSISSDKEAKISYNKKITFGFEPAAKNGLYDYECLLDNNDDKKDTNVPSLSALDEQTTKLLK